VIGRMLTTAVALLAVVLPAAPAAASDAPGPPADLPIRIMPLGDSITYGVGTPNDSGYRHELYDRLATAGLNVDFVGGMTSGIGADLDNEGHPGWTIEQVAAKVDDWIAATRPDVILLHIGTNDFRDGATTPTAPTRLSALLDRIAVDAPAAQVLVAKITGAGTTANRMMWKRRIDAYDARVTGIVASKGAQFHLVDQSTIEGIDLNDVVHPNTYGYSRMAWNWYRALEPVLNTSGVPWPSTGDPSAVTSAVRCIAQSSGQIAAHGLGCHTWYLRGHTWRLPVQITKIVKDKVRVKGKIISRPKRVRVTTWINGY
jgi:lysophospholipase L1-like esterase